MQHGQATDLQRPLRNSFVRISGKIFTWGGMLLSVISGIIAIYVFVIEFRSKPLVNLSVLDNQCLTRVVSVPNLGSHFRFRGREVRNLWVSKIQLVNKCRRNIIGLPGRDLMYSNLVVSVTNGFNVVAAEMEYCDFDVMIANTSNEIGLSFEKWRPNQVCVIKVYSEGVFDGMESLLPRFISNKDPFTQGELMIVDYKEITKPLSLLRHFPCWFCTFMTWFGIAGFGIIFISFVWWFIINWVRFLRLYRWNHKYRVVAIEAINSRKRANEGGGMIEAMDDDFWRDSSIPRPPRQSVFIKRGKVDWGEMIVTNGFILIVLMLSFVALSALICV